MSFTPTTAEEGVCPGADVGTKKLENSRQTVLPTMCLGARRGANLCMTGSRILRERFDVKRSFQVCEIGFNDHAAPVVKKYRCCQRNRDTEIVLNRARRNRP